MIPSEIPVLVSFLNTKLRDEGVTLSELCAELGLDEGEIVDRLFHAGYAYEPEKRVFYAY